MPSGDLPNNSAVKPKNKVPTSSTSNFTHHPRVTKARAALYAHVHSLTQLAMQGFWVNLHLLKAHAMRLATGRNPNLLGMLDGNVDLPVGTNSLPKGHSHQWILAVVAPQKTMVFSASFVQRPWERNGTNVNVFLGLADKLWHVLHPDRSQYFVRDLPQHLHPTAHAGKWAGNSWSELSYL